LIQLGEFEAAQQERIRKHQPSLRAREQTARSDGSPIQQNTILRY
jgi:hypothetical protein